MKIKTETLKELVGKSINGASNDKLIPLTQFMGIKCGGKTITLLTTDATNYLYVYGDVDNDDELQVTVFAEQFAKLISKMTCKEVELNLTDSALQVKGNGDYTVELPLDENGELVIFPDVLSELGKIKYDGTIESSEIKAVVDSAKSSLATTDELPSIQNYFVGDKVIATDRYKITSYEGIKPKKEILMSAKLMDLLSLFDGSINYKIDKSCMIFEDEHSVVYSKQMDDVSEYPIDALERLIDGEFKSVCKVNKNEFIALLERIALFVGKYDDRAVRLYFEKNGIRVSNKNRKSNELIEYIDSKKFKAYDCTISVDMLLSQLKAYDGEAVEIHYNNDAGIKFVGESTVQITALMQDE